ncbi:MAG: hypothetical protein GX803_09855 [Lentisphaerae bacterium]|jgi:general secretion pathway protein F|nr:hypothetical protein [Lentisphaerota bacterium]
MTTFEYQGFDSTGRARSGLIEALDLKDARKRLAARGILAEKVRAAGGADARRTLRGAAFPVEARAMLYRELAVLLGSGIALVPALDLILQAPELDRSRSRLAAVRDAVREGQPLSAALAGASSRVTAFERAIIEVGERVGGMDAALERLAGFLEEQEKLRERLTTALIYPAVVVALALLIGAGVMVFMLPKVQELLLQTNQELPWITRALLGGGRLAGWALLLALALLLAGSVLTRRRLRNDRAFLARLDRRLFALPVLGAGWRNLVSLRFVRVLGLLLERGVGLVESVPLAARATGSAWLMDCAVRETAALSEGKPLVEVIRGMQPLHPTLASWVQAGEAGGNLPGMLESSAARFQQGWDRLATRGVQALEIAMTLALGIFVALIALAVLLPILQINKGMM